MTLCKILLWEIVREAFQVVKYTNRSVNYFACQSKEQQQIGLLHPKHATLQSQTPLTPFIWEEISLIGYRLPIVNNIKPCSIMFHLKVINARYRCLLKCFSCGYVQHMLPSRRTVCVLYGVVGGLKWINKLSRSSDFVCQAGNAIDQFGMSRAV